MTYRVKNIVVCLDGTGNQIEENISNVLKLYRSLDKGDAREPRQVVFYDQGVGTIGQKGTWGVLSQKAASIWSLATGHGLDDNVLRAYTFIARNFCQGRVTGADGRVCEQVDRIYIFGYSRGAHTARVLAALIYHIGMLRPEQLNLAGAALTAYKRAGSKTGESEVSAFRRITQAPSVPIEFVGVWDTVSSMIVPREDRFLIPTIEKLPNTRSNPGVRVFRHAMAIDEARYMFRLAPWDEGQEFKYNIHASGERQDQDCQQVWFAGYHGDVGGGNPREASGASQYPLCWMIKEAMINHLRFNPRTVDYVAQGIPYGTTTEYMYPKPDPQARLHSSQRCAWALLEVIPKLARFRESGAKKKRRALFGLYLPLWEKRAIPEGANIHQSVIDRMSNSDYRPANFPDKYETIAHDGRPASNWLR